MDPEIPVIRWTPPKGFVDWQKHVREAEAKAFCEEKLKPLLDKIERSWRSCLGQDFARSQDLSVIHPMLVTGNLMRRTPFILELRDVPFTTQEQILFYIIDRLRGSFMPPSMPVATAHIWPKPRVRSWDLRSSRRSSSARTGTC